jgi:Zn-dependent membrane protease YugP
MAILLGLLLLLALIYGPQFWVRAVMARYGRDRPDFPGSGGELAEHLLERNGLAQVPVVVTATGDHYDPEQRRVALTADHYYGRSLTAVAVAAHEVGHALQHQAGYGPLLLRHRLVRLASGMQRAGSAVAVASPLLLAVTRTPAALVLPLVVALASMASGVVVHLVTLPVELDASFRRALPLLRQGGYLPDEDHPAARRILTAAALTYVAGALSQLLNLWRWLRLLRR